MPSDETERLGFLLHDAARLLRRAFEKRADQHGLSAAHWRLLVRVFKEEGVAQARLAELLEIEPISVSRLIDRMEEAGWIERRADPGDRRVRTIYLTDRSRAIFGDMRGVADDVYETALAGLDADTRRTTINGLKAIIQNLSDDDQKAAANPVQKASRS
ncbi:MarR family transcriptional regulator [Mesorhizobium sp. CAU 1741]|uniref:MarR family winged helix-turn-helix transcriptional regulator n=1 Tax=Mesorhizobium sp. CAU 1741 TaxID=3140366 RepID=UPI00325AA033